MQQALGSLLLIIAGLLIVLSQSLYTVDETEQALLLQFGQPVGSSSELIRQPGLHFKIPFVQDVRRFDRRILSVDPAPQSMNVSSAGTILQDATKEEQAEADAQASGEPILVDTFARYRIVDPLAFLKTLREVGNANLRITDIMNNITRNVLGKRTLDDILSEKRIVIMEEMRERMNTAMKSGGFGVELIDVRIVRADLTEKLRTSTVNRMITERREKATEKRAQGRESALEIKSTAEKERTVLLAEAQKTAQIIRGEGDETAIQTYAKAFNVDPGFYSFIRSMEAYSNTLSDEDTQLILSPDNAFLKFLQGK